MGSISLDNFNSWSCDSSAAFLLLEEAPESTVSNFESTEDDLGKGVVVNELSNIEDVEGDLGRRAADVETLEISVSSKLKVVEEWSTLDLGKEDNPIKDEVGIVGLDENVEEKWEELSEKNVDILLGPVVKLVNDFTSLFVMADLQTSRLELLGSDSLEITLSWSFIVLESSLHISWEDWAIESIGFGESSRVISLHKCLGMSEESAIGSAECIDVNRGGGGGIGPLAEEVE